jgi:ectoine hydroxylase-related dioxygenase (phytanoyl-CoA dioxygenase family)
MLTTAFPSLVSGGVELEPDSVHPLRESNDVLDAPALLRRRLQEEGYLFLRGVLDREDVLAARREMMQRLAQDNLLDPSRDPIDGFANPGAKVAFRPDLALHNQILDRVLYDGPMIALMQKLIDAPVRHFDFTWVRAVAPGKGTPCHLDSVYMNRGTHNLYTAWTPIGDVDFEQGGLIVLERSNHHHRLRETYGMQDVDAYCENKPEARSWGKAWGTGGSLKGTPNQIRRSVGGQWRTAEYRAGDVLIFSIFTVHASLDNRSTRIRLSSDSRYQSALEPADERWIGPNPIGHSQAGKRGRIC